MDRKILLDKAKNAKRESKQVDFKASFDVNSSRDWVEIIKDIVAMANTNGGVIIFGVNNNGTLSGFDYSHILDIDPATLTDKISHYTNEQFSDFEVVEVKRRKQTVAALLINEISIPLVFSKPGTFDIGEGKQKSVFSRGTIYFRHGAKSEPGISDDLRIVIERELEKIRGSWLGDIKKVITAPPGYEVQMMPLSKKLPTEVTGVKIVNGNKGIPVKLVSYDDTHPYRQKEIIESFNQKTKKQKTINAYDIFCVRRIYNIDNKKIYFFKPKHGSPLYSDAFIEWIIKCYKKDHSFFEKTRDKYKKL